MRARKRYQKYVIRCIKMILQREISAIAKQAGVSKTFDEINNWFEEIKIRLN
jgi:hypothetical protein